jgi:phosphate:Na+ symporter
MFESIFGENRQWSLATFNLSYNLIYTLILLACLNPIVALVTKIVREKQEKGAKLRYIDDRLLATPPIAVGQALKEVRNMAVMAKENLDRAFKAILDEDMSESKVIAAEEYQIDYITRSLASFFIKVSSTPISDKDKKLIGGLHHVINDIERIGDHAVLFAKETNYMIQNEAHFLDWTKTELREIYAKISELFELSLDSFQTRKAENLVRMSALHQEIIDLIAYARDIHIKRLSSNMYSVEVSKSMYAVLLSLQRVSDHIINIGFSVRSDTGSKTEAFKNIEKDKKKSS